ncbi:sulfatase-like hydrolase/transferase [Horticoccus sp. 23ND18S-11]|uniref:sulfatase-like hydrolase/transferase n=1 Tax=Horticoccus sp. 23ND18S-11 TaxID=3391832 RepID=UPI0039C93468
MTLPPWFRSALCLALSIGALASAQAAAPRPPNIVLIMADDFGYEAVTANGGESYQTPNLDRLAASGMRFEHCYVQPLCTPTRVQLMTGIYNVRNYINFGTLDPKATTFAHLLKRAGYVTGICGKWQLGQGKDLPQHFGFDDALLWQHTRLRPRYANPGLERNGESLDYSHGEYGPTLINDFASQFVTQHKDKPFFLYYPMILTHDPFQPTPDSAEWDPKTKSEQEQRNVKHFADMTAYMDKMVGRLVKRLEELGLRENTLILFLGDNGTGVQVTSQFKGKPYQGGKGTGNASGNHVPLIASWPGHIPAGRVNADLVGSVDFLPTICEAAGAKAPGPAEIDGQSFLPQLLGQNGTPREWLYTWYVRNGGPVATYEYAMTTRHKLYRDGSFFDLTADRFETKPRSATAPTGAEAVEVKKLQAALDRFTHARPAHLLTLPPKSTPPER